MAKIPNKAAPRKSKEEPQEGKVNRDTPIETSSVDDLLAVFSSKLRGHLASQDIDLNSQELFNKLQKMIAEQVVSEANARAHREIGNDLMDYVDVLGSIVERIEIISTEANELMQRLEEARNELLDLTETRDEE